MRNPTDERVHFSELRAMAKSPAHYRLACEESRKSSRAMLVGQIADNIVFHKGRDIARYPGKVRNGREWDAFRDLNARKILCIQSELDEADGAASAVAADPLVQSLLAGAEFQRVMKWEAYGLPCAAGIPGQRGGFDILNESKGFIGDLKITADAEPSRLMRHATTMHWDSQGAWYVDGACALGLRITDFYLIAVEATPPHAVTVLRASAEVLEHGRKKLRLWAERLIACEAANEWPGYAQSVLEWELPAWVTEDA